MEELQECGSSFLCLILSCTHKKDPPNGRIKMLFALRCASCTGDAGDRYCAERTLVLCIYLRAKCAISTMEAIQRHASLNNRPVFIGIGFYQVFR